jgi:hypothetical protein
MTDLAALDARIHSAWAALSGARVAAQHSLNGDTCAIENLCERTLNELLENLWDGLDPQARAAVNARPVKQSAAA